ncbi:DUF1853 family protein [Aquimarina sp. AU474]|uniref:DUF1853 family protein n=1 Tax=Aquimarina sp. AU474 TaxID=2108529 RepID=UPI000D69E337|nr:DUF1853 family protein [Aquimarina sp. AU474]
MQIKERYLGFLESKSLWEKKTVIGLSQFCFDLFPEVFPVQDTVNISIPANEVLGKRVESFFEYYILQSNRYTLLAKNLQIFRDKITIGELDFLVFDTIKKKQIHIELVYKFYVYDLTIDMESDRWIGPNRNDSLSQKIEKLKVKQLPLLFKPETKPILENLEIELDAIEQQVCFMGHLFIPLSMQGQHIPLLNNHCISGFWITIKDFRSKSYGAFQYCIPQKKNWIVNPKYCTSWLSFNDIQESIEIAKNQKKSLLLWMKSSKDSFERFFIVWW